MDAAASKRSNSSVMLNKTDEKLRNFHSLRNKKVFFVDVAIPGL